MFITGGPVHGAAFGVFTAALARAGTRTGGLPRAVTATAMVSAVAGLLSPLYFAWAPAGWLIPAGRFPGLVTAAIAGVRMRSGRMTDRAGGTT